jgi:hypothetical protein
MMPQRAEDRPRDRNPRAGDLPDRDRDGYKGERFQQPARIPDL